MAKAGRRNRVKVTREEGEMRRDTWQRRGDAKAGRGNRARATLEEGAM